MKKKIFIFIGGSLCSAPRAHKEALALSRFGHEVTIWGCWTKAALAERDRQMVQDQPYQFRLYLDLLAPNRPCALWERFRTRVGRLAACRFRLENPWALGYGTGAMRRVIKKHRPDFSIFHNESGLPVAREGLRRGQRVGVDFEDWFSQQEKCPVPNLLAELESFLLTRCVYCTCPSEAMADAMRMSYQCPRPQVIWNSFAFSDNPPTTERSVSAIWFSQSLGPDRGLEGLMRAFNRCRETFHLTLIGDDDREFQSTLLEMVSDEKKQHIHFLPTVPPEQLPLEIRKHGIGLAIEAPPSLSRELTLTNKIFQYLEAGCLVVASDTKGQTQLAAELETGITTFSAGNESELAAALDRAVEQLRHSPQLHEEIRKSAAKKVDWTRFQHLYQELLSRSFSSSNGGVVVQMTTAPHVKAAVFAANRIGRLEKFVTTIHVRKGSVLAKTLSLCGGWGRKFANRSMSPLPSSSVHIFPVLEIIRALALRVPRLGPVLGDWAWEKSEPALDRRAASLISPDTAFVYGWEFGVASTFAKARSRNIHCFYEVPSLHNDWIQNLLDQEYTKHGIDPDPRHRQISEKHRERQARRDREWETADTIIMNSRFTYSTYVQHKGEDDRVEVFPLGAPPPRPHAIRRWRETRTRKKRPYLIWAGSFSLRKGAHYLLGAVNRSAQLKQLDFGIFGALTLPGAWKSQMPSNMVFHGPVSQETLFTEMEKADALILPTLADAFGMVVTEALAAGLPILTTSSAGASELLESGQHGEVFQSASEDEIISAIGRFLSRSDDWEAMRQLCQETAGKQSWEAYYDRLGSLIESRLHP